ncbi:MAG: hypothetical protein A2073_04035 [Deltaproteobacteria bacterium GWC2_42_11]|nr:MAG: hypothetical protein A2073_04035 [Deltaproteobacteria bacterium GWC2_42_11]HBO83721.1 hypothetical protein [Deltaproteobacteria bacterium]
MIDRKTIILIFMPFISVIIMFIAGSLVRFKPALSSTERQYLTFAPESVDITERHPVLVTGSIRSPLDIPPAVTGRDFPVIPLEAVVPKGTSPPSDKEVQEKEKKVSFILINAGRKFAIINGRVLREGDAFEGDSRVVSIEKDRVMIKEAGKEGKWVKMN